MIPAPGHVKDHSRALILFSSRPFNNFVHSFCHRTLVSFVAFFIVCSIDPSGSNGNKIDTNSYSDSDSDSHTRQTERDMVNLEDIHSLYALTIAA